MKRLRKQPSRQEAAEQEAASTTFPYDHDTVDWGVFRRLVLLGFSPKLEIVFQTVGARDTMSEEVQNHIAAGDYGFALFWAATTQV